MSQSLTIRLTDDTYRQLQQEALASGTSPEKLAAAALERQWVQADAKRSEAERQLDRERFERHFGEIDSNCGADNHSIDNDLAHEY